MSDIANKFENDLDKLHLYIKQELIDFGNWS